MRSTKSTDLTPYYYSRALINLLMLNKHKMYDILFMYLCSLRVELILIISSQATRHKPYICPIMNNKSLKVLFP